VRAQRHERTVRPLLAHTASVVFAVYGRWEHGSPLRPDDVERVKAAFRPDDEGACVWTEPDEPNVLRLSVDVDAASFEEALHLGRAALLEAASTASLSGEASEVVAMTDEGQAVWTP
jgi:hypothetical protein